MEQLSLNITGCIADIMFSSLQITIPEEARVYIEDSKKIFYLI
jgi:hypothetical protein